MLMSKNVNNDVSKDSPIDPYIAREALPAVATVILGSLIGNFSNDDGNGKENVT